MKCLQTCPCTSDMECPHDDCGSMQCPACSPEPVDEREEEEMETNKVQDWVLSTSQRAVVGRFDVMERVRQAELAGIPFVMATVTQPPMVGTDERADWERTCDRCRDVVPMEQATTRVHQVLNHPATQVRIVMVVMICHPCIRALGADPTSFAAGHEASHAEAVEQIRQIENELPGDAFRVVFGELGEHAEHAVDLHETRKERELP